MLNVQIYRENKARKATSHITKLVKNTNLECVTPIIIRNCFIGDRFEMPNISN